MPKSERKKYVGLFTKLLSHIITNVRPLTRTILWCTNARQRRARGWPRELVMGPDERAALDAYYARIYMLLCCVCIWCLPNKKTNKLEHKQQQQQQQQQLLQKKNNNSALSHRRRPWGWVWWRRYVWACSKVVGSHARSSCAVRDLLLCCVRVCVCALVCLIVVAFSRDWTNLLLFATI